MVKRLLSFLISLAFIAPLAYAQTEEEYADQSEIVTVLNETDADGNYIVGRSEDGYPTVTFRFTVPADATTFFHFGMESSSTSAYQGYYNMYYQESNVSYLLYSFFKATVESDGGDYNKSFYYSGSASCQVGTDEFGRRVQDYTLVVSKFDNRHYSVPFGNFSVKFPSVAVVLRDEAKFKSIYKKYAAATYNFVSDGTTLSGNVKSSDLETVDGTSHIYLNAGAVLNVDNEFTCKNIYVEAADEANNRLPAGIVIDESGSLVADSVYFFANQDVDYGVGYLINKGTCSAGVAFLKNASNNRTLDAAYANEYGYVTNAGDTRADNRWYFSLPTFSSPVAAHDGNVDMDYRQLYDASKADDLFTTGLWSPFLVGDLYSSLFGLANVTKWDDYYNTDASIPFYIQHLYTNSHAVRVSGDINDADNYELPVADIASSGQPSQTFVSNPYPAPVDWRSVMETLGEEVASDIRDIQQSPYSPAVTSIYNFKTGLTTTDAKDKMYYGYLQPNMSHVQLLHNAGEVGEVAFTKQDLSSLQQADEKYAGEDITNGLPYIRFYVDDTNPSLAKGIGKRSVVAIYFVSQDEFNSLHSTDNADYDATYDVNKVYESLAETRVNSVNGLKNSTGWLFPYVGAYGESQTADDVATAIKMVAMPQSVGATSVLGDFIRISIESKKTEGGVEFGILDYDLKTSNLGVQVGGLSLNYPNVTDVLTTDFDVEKGYTEGETTSEFVAGKTYCEWGCKQLSLNLTVAKNEETPKYIEDDTVAADVYARGSAIVVSTSEAGVLRVFDLSGRVVAEQSVSAGDASVAMPAGVYVASFNAGGSSCVKSVIVK